MEISKRIAETFGRGTIVFPDQSRRMIDHLRKDEGLSIKQIATAADVTEQYIWDIIESRAGFSTTQILNLRKNLNCSLIPSCPQLDDSIAKAAGFKSKEP